MDIYPLLSLMIERKASDLYLKVDSPPALRVDGYIVKMDMDELTDEDTLSMTKEILTEHQWQIFEKRPDLDFSYEQEEGVRYRFNVFRQQGHIGMVIRLIKDSQLDFDNLHLPRTVQELAELPRGLVIVTGATGSGKSTTLAAMIHHINKKYARHIMTIEDPIEFIHQEKRSIINQREVGYDTRSFKDALRHVVRQSPDVILIGEMRDMDTMMTAVAAAETGHLVLTTMHTVDVSQTLDRIINYFPEYLRQQVRHELSLSLHGIICMRLLRRQDKPGRIPALEIMRTTPSIKKALKEGEFWRLKELMQHGEDMGMTTFNQDLLKLYKKGTISFEEALYASSNPEEFKLNAKGMYTGTDSIRLYQREE